MLEYHETIECIEVALDAKSPYTAGLSKSVSDMVEILCRLLGLNRMMHIASHLHDIGKTQIPYEILSKDGPLTEEEFEIMKSHTTLGYNICMKDLRLRPYAEGALYHHEALNGTGYPQGLKKEDIPFVARRIRNILQMNMMHWLQNAIIRLTYIFLKP